MAAYSAQFQTTAAYVSAATWFKPQYAKALYQQYPDEYKQTLFASLGLSFDKFKPFSNYSVDSIGGLTARWFEEPRSLEIPFQISATTNANPGAGNAVTFTLSTTTPGGYMQSGASSFPQVGEVWEHAVTGIQARITAVNKAVANTHTFTFQPINTGDNLVNAVNQWLFRVSNAYAEGTGQPDGHTGDWIERTAPFQIIKATNDSTGSAMIMENWVPMTATDPDLASALGIPVGSKYVKATDEANKEFWRHVGMCDRACFIGKPSNQVGFPTTVESMDYQIRTYSGNTFNYNAGSITSTDFDTWNVQLNTQGAAKLMMMGVGDLFAIDMENFIKSEFPNGGILYGDLKGKEDIAVNVGFKSFTKSGRSFVWTVYTGFHNPNSFDVPGTTYRRRAYLIPETTINTMDSTGKSAKMPSFSILYPEAPGGGYSRRLETFLTGSANMGMYMATNETDSRRINFRSHIAFRMPCANQFAVIDPV